MRETRRSYYRNWYQHWQQEKEEEEKLQAMKYFSEMQEEEEGEPYSIDVEMYRANHEFSRQHANAPLRGNQRVASRQMASRGNSKTGSDALRGVLLGLPLLLVFAAIMYAADIIPEDMVNRIFNAGGSSAIVTYVEQHDEAMILHNEINQMLERYVPTEAVTPEFQEELRTKHALVQERTNLLMEQTDATFSNMNRLWALKMTSLNEMVNYVLTHDEVTPEVLAYYSQFVMDQNEIGEQISLALSTLLSTNDIEYIEMVTGDIQIVG